MAREGWRRGCRLGRPSMETGNRIGQSGNEPRIEPFSSIGTKTSLRRNRRKGEESDEQKASATPCSVNDDGRTRRISAPARFDSLDNGVAHKVP